MAGERQHAKGRSTIVLSLFKFQDYHPGMAGRRRGGEERKGRSILVCGENGPSPDLFVCTPFHPTAHKAQPSMTRVNWIPPAEIIES
jgi:hypothetical protein